MLKMLGNYDMAQRWAYTLDDQPMVHNGHSDKGGWGVHWRLDEVLGALYPSEHTEACWPAPPWYGADLALENPIEIMTDLEVKLFDPGLIDARRADLEEQINIISRDELERHGPVWNKDELEQEFHILGHRPPFAVVVRREDKERGTMLYQDEPRFYFGFDTRRVI